MELIVRTLGNAAGLWLAARFMSGLTVPGDQSAVHTWVNLIVVGLILALVNSLIKPVAKLIAFPLYVLTFGLFALIVNGAMLMLTSLITDRLVGVGAEAGLTLGLHVGSFGTAILASVLISIVSALVVGVLGPRKQDD